MSKSATDAARTALHMAQDKYDTAVEAERDAIANGLTQQNGAHRTEKAALEATIADLKQQLATASTPKPAPVPAPVPAPTPAPVPAPSPAGIAWQRQTLLDATKDATPVPSTNLLPRFLTNAPGWQLAGPVARVGGRYVTTFPKSHTGGHGNGEMEFSGDRAQLSRRVVLDEFEISRGFQQHPVETKLFFFALNQLYVTLKGPGFVPHIAVQGDENVIVVPGVPAAKWGAGPLANNVTASAGITPGTRHRLALQIVNTPTGLTLQLELDDVVLARYADVRLSGNAAGYFKWNPIWGGAGGIVAAPQSLSFRAIELQGAK